MLKVVYNGDYGGFSFSEKAVAWLKERGLENASTRPYDIPRHHPLLVECVETLGEKANGRYARLYVATIHGWKYRIDEYDGSETVIEPTESEWTTVTPEEMERLRG